MPRHLGLVTASALAFAFLAPAAAQADRWQSADATGDVDGFNYDPEPAPCGTSTELDASAEVNEDITRVGVRHTRRAVVVTAEFQDLLVDQEQVITVNLRTPSGGFELFVDRQPPGSGDWGAFTDLSTEPRYPDPNDVPECGSFSEISEGVRCKVGADLRFGKNLVRMTVPRSCLDNPRWVRVALGADRFVLAGETFDIYSDEWNNGGKELSYWLPPFGPRVRATAGAPVGTGHPDQATTGQNRHVVVRDGREIARR